MVSGRRIALPSTAPPLSWAIRKRHVGRRHGQAAGRIGDQRREIGHSSAMSPERIGESLMERRVPHAQRQEEVLRSVLVERFAREKIGSK